MDFNSFECQIWNSRANSIDFNNESQTVKFYCFFGPPPPAPFIWIPRFIDIQVICQTLPFIKTPLLFGTKE